MLTLIFPLKSYRAGGNATFNFGGAPRQWYGRRNEPVSVTDRVYPIHHGGG